MSERQELPLAELELKVKDFCDRALAMAIKLDEIYGVAVEALTQDAGMKSQHCYNPAVLREAMREIVEVIARA